MYNFNTDKNSQSGFISLEELMKKITPEEIFEYVFGHYPEEFTLIFSPFRADTKPGCFFYYGTDDKLWFSDFANTKRIGRIKMHQIDCFNAVQVKYRLQNFFQVLEFIKYKILEEKKKTRQLPPRKKHTKRLLNNILINPINFTRSDEEYWNKFDISINNLIEDKVFRTSHYKLTYENKDPLLKEVNELCYAYTDFKSGTKKLYMPYNKMRFLTNCSQNDIGGFNTLVEKGEEIVISKSYKDYRILKNQGLNTIWFQSEVMTPIDDILIDIIERFNKVYVFFDNDNTGLESGKRLVDKISSFKIVESKQIYLPLLYLKYKITDPGDLIEKKGVGQLLYFLKQNNILK